MGLGKARPSQIFWLTTRPQPESLPGLRAHGRPYGLQMTRIALLYVSLR